MSHQSLRSLCILSTLLILTFPGCRSGKDKEASIDPPPAPEAEMGASSPLLPPMPSLGRSRPRLTPGGPDSPLETPPRYRATSPTGRSSLNGPSLPLPAPPAEEF